MSSSPCFVSIRPIDRPRPPFSAITLARLAKYIEKCHFLLNADTLAAAATHCEKMVAVSDGHSIHLSTMDGNSTSNEIAL